MPQLNEHPLLAQPGTPETPSIPTGTQSRWYRRGGATSITLIVLLAVIFGTGLFSGWVFGTRSSGGNQSRSTLAATASSDTLGAMREAAVRNVRPAVVQVNVVTASGEGLGSGVILDSRGYIVTNNHVITGAQRIQVMLYDGISLPAQLIGIDQLDDLAVVKISTTTKLTAAVLGDSSKLQVGQEVLAIGNPLGITQTVTSGIVSALDRPVSSLPDAIQTDAAINPGNSGGALVDLQGKLVGIPTLSAIDPQSKTPANGVGFAVPSNRVHLIVPQLIQSGKVTSTGRATMGIQITSVDATLATQNNLSINAGALIVEIVATGSAATAGLKAGDVIVQIGTHTVTEGADVADALLVLSPGEIVPVSVYRGKEQLTIRVMLGEAQIP